MHQTKPISMISGRRRWLSVAHPLDARFEPVTVGPKLVETFDATFAGFGGEPIKAWLLPPRERSEPLPCVVEFIGYGGGRGHPLDWLSFSVAGYAHLIMDTRGQGSTWRKGDTPDPEIEPGNAQFPGFMTRGVLSPRHLLIGVSSLTASAPWKRHGRIRRSIQHALR